MEYRAFSSDSTIELTKISLQMRLLIPVLSTVLSFLKHDSVVQREIYDLSYLYKCFVFLWKSKKNKNYFGRCNILKSLTLNVNKCRILSLLNHAK